MKNLLDAFWRALAYCLHPRVVFLSLLPLVLMVCVGLAFALWGWQPAVDAIHGSLEGTALQAAINQAAGWMGWPQLKAIVPALLVIFAITPLLAVLALLSVAWLMTPMLVRMVAQRRFATLQRKHGATPVGSAAWSLGHTVLALLLLLASLPFWLLPPLVLVLPPLIWGWLAYRVMAFDALSEHASKEERRAIMQQHRMELLLMGVITGLLGAAPGVVWASFALFAMAFVVLIPAAVWIYALVFAFSSLWFSHYCLAALQQWRAEHDVSASRPGGANLVTATMPAHATTPAPLSAPGLPALPSQEVLP